jgi:hypothetical protein
MKWEKITICTFAVLPTSLGDKYDYRYVTRSGLITGNFTVMRGALRGGVFGGNAGLWLFQKKFRSKDNDSNQLPVPVSVQVEQKKSPCIPEGDGELDDDRCQRVSSRRLHQSPVNCSGESTQFSIASCKSDDSHGKKIEAEQTHCYSPTINKTARNNKRGVFGVRKRQYENCCSDSESTLATASTYSERDSDETNIRRIKPTSTFSSDRILKERQLHSVSSEGHSSPSMSSGDVGSSYCDDVTCRPFQHGHVENTVVNVATKLSQQSETLSVFDFDKDPIQSSEGKKPEIDIARQFFAQLDSDQTLLQIEDVRDGPEPPSISKKSRIVKTTRGKLPLHVATEEYSKYCQACRTSKVKPFSIERFLQQRSEYFRVGDVYDGMFDE